MKALRIALLLCFSLESVTMESHIVSAPAGVIEGIVENVLFDGTGFKVRKYLGIPYAEAPIGYRRFKKPFPIKPVKSTYRATELKEICIQGDDTSLPRNKTFKESEDCLFLNIYAPYTEPGQLTQKAVMVYIHGGYGKYTFINGAANFVSGDVLSVVGDVILVTINYRLSLLGFFSMEDNVIRGNFGLWDQHEALKWVHNNIAAFGGDPDKVTLFGEGQGAVSAILQTFYPDNLGLFQKVIAEKGTPFPALNEGLSPFLTHTYPVMRTVQTFGCFGEDFSSIRDCMKNVSISSLKQFIESGYDLEAVTPKIDGDFIMDTANKMTEFENVARSNMFSEVDMMLGFEELQETEYLNFDLGCNSINDHDSEETGMHESFIRDLLTVVYGYGIPELSEKIIVNRYTAFNADKTEIQIENYKNLKKITNDAFTFIPSIRTYQSHINVSLNANTILYKLNNNRKYGDNNAIALDSEFAVNKRFYKFGFSREVLAAHNMSQFKPSRTDVQKARKIMEFYTDFATDKESSTYKYSAGVTGSQNDSDVVISIPCVVLPSGELVDYKNDPSVEFWLDIVPPLLHLTRPSFSMDHGGHRFDPPDTEDDGHEKDISKEGANAVIIALGVITGLLCLCLVAMGVFVLVVKIRRTRFKSSA